jgi:hypothetical protein
VALLNNEVISEYTKSPGPRVIKKHKESEYTDTSSSWFKITTFFSLFAVVPAWQLINETYPITTQLILSAVALVSTRYWLKYCGMDPRKADKNYIHFWFWVDKKLGRHSYYRFTTGDSWIERILGRKLSFLYPVVAIYPGGLVQFDDNQWCIYADLAGKKKDEEERKLHRMYMKGVIDGMFDRQIVKFHSSSKTNPRKAVINYLNELADKPGSKERSMHLNSLIEKVIKDNREAKTQRNFVMIGLGEHDNLDSAIIAKNSRVPAMLNNLKRAKLEPKLILNRRQIEKLLRESVSETAVF